MSRKWRRSDDVITQTQKEMYYNLVFFFYSFLLFLAVHVAPCVLTGSCPAFLMQCLFQMQMSRSHTLNLTVWKQQSVLVYIIPHVFSPKDIPGSSTFPTWDWFVLTYLCRKTAVLVKALHPSFSFWEIFFPHLNLQHHKSHSSNVHEGSYAQTQAPFVRFKWAASQTAQQVVLH